MVFRGAVIWRELANIAHADAEARTAEAAPATVA